VTDSDLSGNQAITTVGFDNFGGALYNNGGTATITGSTLANNQALGGGSFSPFGGSGGGAVENSGGAALMVTGCRFTGNLAMGADGQGYGSAGGALDNEFGSVANISSTELIGNRAQPGPGDGGAEGGGGAIENEFAGSGSILRVTNCSFSDNQAIAGAGGGIGRFGASAAPLDEHPLLGRMTLVEWERFHCLHCAHHLSFVVPATREDALERRDAKTAGHSSTMTMPLPYRHDCV